MWWETWAAAARKHGLRFGVTVHQARNWWWFQTSHGADKSGPMAGVSYDGRMTRADGKGQWWQGLDPQMLYGPKHPKDALPDVSYVKNFYDRTRDLIDQHDPDLLYFDNALLPLGWGGMNVGAYFYNHNLKTRGKMEAVLNIKNVPDKLAKAVVADYERGLTSGIMPYAWQSETCIGEWHYRRSLFEGPGAFGGYLPPRDVIHWLIDTVSKNGTFILNVPGKPDGTIDSKEMAVLDEHCGMAEDQRRSHLRDSAMEDLRRGTEFGEERTFPGRQHQCYGKQGHPLHAQQGEHRDLCNLHGMATEARARLRRWERRASSIRARSRTSPSLVRTRK